MLGCPDPTQPARPSTRTAAKMDCAMVRNVKKLAWLLQNVKANSGYSLFQSSDKVEQPVGKERKALESRRWNFRSFRVIVTVGLVFQEGVRPGIVKLDVSYNSISYTPAWRSGSDTQALPLPVDSNW
eukprot:g61115.t1